MDAVSSAGSPSDLRRWPDNSFHWNSFESVSFSSSLISNLNPLLKQILNRYLLKPLLIKFQTKIFKDCITKMLTNYCTNCTFWVDTVAVSSLDFSDFWEIRVVKRWRYQRIQFRCFWNARKCIFLAFMSTVLSTITPIFIKIEKHAFALLCMPIVRKIVTTLNSSTKMVTFVNSTVALVKFVCMEKGFPTESCQRDATESDEDVTQ